MHKDRFLPRAVVQVSGFQVHRRFQSHVGVLRSLDYAPLDFLRLLHWPMALLGLAPELQASFASGHPRPDLRIVLAYCLPFLYSLFLSISSRCIFLILCFLASMLLFRFLKCSACKCLVTDRSRTTQCHTRTAYLPPKPCNVVGDAMCSDAVLHSPMHP